METPSGQPSEPSGAVSLTQRLNDFDQLAGFFSQWDGRFEQLSAGRFDGNLTVVQGRGMRLVSLRCNQVILARGRPAPGLFSLYPVSASNADGTWHGRHLAPGHLVTHGPDAETDHRTALSLEMMGLSASAVLIHDAARTLTGVDLPAGNASWAALHPSPRIYANIQKRLRQFLTLAGRSTSAEAHLLEQECLRAIVAGITPAAPLSRSLPPLPVRTALVRNADDLMRANLQSPQGVIDLCAALRVSDRSLRLAFHERFGIGPMTYYRILRLNAVRAELRRTPYAQVSEIARRYGFQHLGNFAADYRKQFGDRPSQDRMARPESP